MFKFKNKITSFLRILKFLIRKIKENDTNLLRCSVLDTVVSNGHDVGDVEGPVDCGRVFGQALEVDVAG
jgi:hypothetical protein